VRVTHYQSLQRAQSFLVLVGYINFIVTVRAMSSSSLLLLVLNSLQLVGVNLCISVVYSVHTSGWTKYYIGGSFAAALIIMIPGGQSDLISLPELLLILPSYSRRLGVGRLRRRVLRVSAGTR
jgi:hypothetical protein